MVAFRDSSSALFAGSTSTSIAAPSALVAGDLMLLLVSNYTNGGPSTPTGWTALDARSAATTGSNGRISSFYKTATSGDVGASYTLSLLAGNNQGVAAILAYSSAAIDAHAADFDGPGTSTTDNTVTTTAASELVVHAFGYRSGNTAATLTLDGALTSRVNQNDDRQSLAVGDVAQASAGVSTARTCSASQSGVFSYDVISLKTAAGTVSTAATAARAARSFTAAASSALTRSTALATARGARSFAGAPHASATISLPVTRGVRGFTTAAAGVVGTSAGRPDATTATGWARGDRGFISAADSDDIPVTPPPGYVLYRRTSLSVPAPTFDDDGWSNPLQTPTTIFDGPWRRLRLKFAGVDRTFFRGVEVRVLRYRHSTPLGAEHCVVELPQATPFERPGVGALDWLAEGKGLRMDLIKPDGTVDQTWTWIGQCQSASPVWNENGFSIQAEYLGFGYQPGDYVQKPLPIRRDSGAVDIGVRLADTLNVTGRHFPPVAPVTTGITTRKRGSLTQSPLDFARELLAEAWTADGRQWTVVSSPGTRTQALQIVLPDTTVDYTISVGQAGISFDGLSEDNDENPNCVYGQWIDANGGLHQRLKWPRLHEDTAPAFPLSVGSVFNPGSGTGGFQPFSDWMRRNGFAGFDSQDTYLASDSDDVEDAQQRMGITVDGIVGAQTWGTAFNTGADVGDLNSAIYMPLAVDTRVEPWLYAPDGKRLGRNPAYDSYIRRKEVFVNLGEGLTYRDARRTAQQIIARAGGISLVGQIVCEGADPEETSWLNAVSGTTLRVRYLWGSGSTGVKFMISSILIEPQDDGHYRVTLDVDTKRRDAFTVAQIIERNREGRVDPARQIRQRTSTQTQDTKIQFDADEIGRIYRHALQGGFWRVVEFPAASWGTFVRVIATTSPAVEFALGLFDTEITPRDLDRLVGNPLATGNTRPWTPDAPALAAAGLIQAWGSAAQPGGYSKVGAADGYKSDSDPLTGRLEYDSNVDFAPANGASLFLAEWVSTSTTMSVRFYLAPVEF